MFSAELKEPLQSFERIALPKWVVRVADHQRPNLDTVLRSLQNGFFVDRNPVKAKLVNFSKRRVHELASIVVRKLCPLS